MILPILVAVLLLGLSVLGIVLHPVRTLFRVVSRIVFILILVIAILGIFVVKDARDFREELAKGDILIRLDSNGTQVAGFALHSMNVTYLSDDILKSVSDEEYDRIVILSWDAIEAAQLDRFEIVNGTSLSLEIVKNIMRSPDDRIALAQELAPEIGVPLDILQTVVLERYKQGEARSMLLSIIFATMYQGNDLMIVSQIKQDLVDIEPSGLLVWAIRVTPSPWLDTASKVVK
jgi:hypothetical protein